MILVVKTKIKHPAVLYSAVHFAGLFSYAMNANTEYENINDAITQNNDSSIYFFIVSSLFVVSVDLTQRLPASVFPRSGTSVVRLCSYLRLHTSKSSASPHGIVPFFHSQSVLLPSSIYSSISCTLV